MRSHKRSMTTVAGLAAAVALVGCTITQPDTSAATTAVAPTTFETTATTVTAAPLSSCDEPVAGNTPPARGYAAMVSLGPDHGVMLTGGETAPPPLGGEVLTDTWTLSSASGWTNQTSCPAPPWGVAAYDQESDRVILFGGVVEGWSDVRELWIFDPAVSEWNRVELDDGPRVIGTYMAYDAESDRTIVFDGRGDTWAYDYNTNTWEEMGPASGPPAREEFAMAYDSESDRVILFGGYKGRVLGDTWAYDYNTNTWTEMTLSEGPQPRDYHAMAYVPTTDRIILYGGGDPVGHDDTWAYDYNTNTWAELAPRFSPGRRAWHSMAYDPRSGMVVLFGGAPRRDPQFHNDTWLYDPSANTWSPLQGVIGGVTLSSSGCEYAGPSEMLAGELTFRLRNKTDGQFNLDVWLLDEGHGYDELATHIDEERRRGKAGEPPLGHPTFVTLVAEVSAPAGEIADLVTRVGAGTYGMACILFDEAGEYGGIWAAGPIKVVE